MGASVTIDDVDPATLEHLRAEAVRRGVAITAVAGEALRRGAMLPLPTGGTGEVEHNDLDALAGTWSAEESEAFAAATASFGLVDRGLWE